MTSAAKVFSTRAQNLYQAIVAHEWDPKILSTPQKVERLVNGDPELEGYRVAGKEVFDETYEYAKFLATQNLQVNEEGEYERTDALSDKEVDEFRREFIMRLPNNIDPTELTEGGIEDISRSNIVLNELVEAITRGNRDLVVNLFRATTAMIQEQKDGF